MFVVSEAEGAAIRAAFEQAGGGVRAAGSRGLRRLFHGIADNAQGTRMPDHRPSAGLEALDHRHRLAGTRIVRERHGSAALTGIVPTTCAAL